jgi:hypothetical protein
MPNLHSTKILGDLRVTGLTKLNEVDAFTLNGQLTSTVATGTAPFVIASTTAVSNLNADLLDGNHASAFYLASNPSGYTTNTGTVTSVGLTAGTGISISGGPITSSGTITVTNSAPDQVVSLTGSGSVSVSGTYPNFTISGTDTNTTYSAGTGLTLTGTTFAANLIDSTLRSVTAEALTTTANRTYAVMPDADGDLVVNVPWVDTNTDTNTTYSISAVDSGTNAIIRLTAGGSGSGTDDITLVAGSNVTLTPSGDNITIASSYTDTNTYPTTFAWTNGTTSGPTGSLTGTSPTVSFAAIPSASGTISGVVTTGAQTFAGDKTFSNKIGIGTSPTSPLHIEIASASTEMPEGMITLKNTTASGEAAIRFVNANTAATYGWYAGLNNSDSFRISYGTANTDANPQFSVSVAGTGTLTGDLTVNGGDITTTASIFNIGNTATSAQTLNLGTAATASATTKTLNLGTGGAAGSTTNINIGSANGGLTTISSPSVLIPGNLTVTGTVTTNNVETVSTSNGVVFEGSAADAFEATLLAGTLTADRTITLPDATGTVALTTDIPSIPNLSVTDNGTGTFVTDVTASGHTITLSRGDFSESDTLATVTGRGATTADQIILNGRNQTPAYNNGALRIQNNVSGGANGITFNSTVNSTSDAGYLWFYDDNNNYAVQDSSENGTLLLAVQNDGGSTSGDAIAIESSGNIFLNPGVASGAIGTGAYNSARGEVYVGNATTKYKVWHENNLTNLNQLTNGPGYITGESDTLDTVADRGATTNQSITTGGLTLSTGVLTHTSTASYDKIRVWNSSSYTIGMNSAQSYGYLNDYAMTFTMNNDADRGFLFRDSYDAASDGAMSLTTDGKMKVKTSVESKSFDMADSSDAKKATMQYNATTESIEFIFN